MSNAFLEPTTTYLYTLRPKRIAMTTDPTSQEIAIAGNHFARLKRYAELGKVIFVGRSLVTNDDCRAYVVFRSKSLEDARNFMANDPMVIEGVMEPQLFPFQAFISQPLD